MQNSIAVRNIKTVGHISVGKFQNRKNHFSKKQHKTAQNSTKQYERFQEENSKQSVARQLHR
jgi:hypothetical protein